MSISHTLSISHSCKRISLLAHFSLGSFHPIKRPPSLCFARCHGCHSLHRIHWSLPPLLLKQSYKCVWCSAEGMNLSPKWNRHDWCDSICGWAGNRWSLPVHHSCLPHMKRRSHILTDHMKHMYMLLMCLTRSHPSVFSFIKTARGCVCSRSRRSRKSKVLTMDTIYCRLMCCFLVSPVKFTAIAAFHWSNVKKTW